MVTVPLDGWPAKTPLGVFRASSPGLGPLAGDVDLDFLAGQFKLSGGNIKNVALAAAFLAAGEAGPVAMRHLLQAVRREYQKMGKVLSGDELNGTPAGTQP
jgi:hypothetical protein